MRWSDRVGRRLKLRDLHIVLAVAEAGSMAKAAADSPFHNRRYPKRSPRWNTWSDCGCSTADYAE